MNTMAINITSENSVSAKTRQEDCCLAGLNLSVDAACGDSRTNIQPAPPRRPVTNAEIAAVLDDPKLEAIINYQAKRQARFAPFSGTEEDHAQDIRVDIVKGLRERFDPAKSSVRTFSAWTARGTMANATRANASVLKHRAGSLDDTLDGTAGEDARPRFPEPAAPDMTRASRLADLKLAVDAVVVELPPDLKRIARAVMAASNVGESMRALGLNRQKFYTDYRPALLREFVRRGFTEEDVGEHGRRAMSPTEIPCANE